jgi:hypothetical protein
MGKVTHRFAPVLDERRRQILLGCAPLKEDTYHLVISFRNREDCRVGLFRGQRLYDIPSGMRMDTIVGIRVERVTRVY